MNINNELERLIAKEIKKDMIYHLKKSFKFWGIERTEEKLKELYTHAPKLLEKYLKVYKELIRRGHLND